MGILPRIVLWILAAVAGVVVLWFLLLGIAAIFINPEKEYEKNSRFCRFLLNGSTAVAMKLLRIHVHVSGLEKLPEGRFLLVGNHRSNFDPIVTWYVLKKQDLAFISKPENFGIPLFGRIIRKCGFLPIDREDPRKAVSTICKASKLLKKDQVSMGVYPEGTRSKDGRLLPFHNGVFKIAQKAEVPIVVLAVQGTESIHRNWYRRKSHVWLDIVKVIPVEEVRESRTQVIGQSVYEVLNNQFGKTEGADYAAVYSSI